MNLRIVYISISFLILLVGATELLFLRKERQLKETYKNDERYQLIRSKAFEKVLLYYYACLSVTIISLAVLAAYYEPLTMTITAFTVVIVGSLILAGSNILRYLLIVYYDKKM